MSVRSRSPNLHEAVILLIGLTPSGWVLFASTPVVSMGLGPRWPIAPASNASRVGGSPIPLGAASVVVGHEGVDPLALHAETLQAPPEPPPSLGVDRPQPADDFVRGG